jgi:glycosyltransferase involved in cell wall biosynthesis
VATAGRGDPAPVSVVVPSHDRRAELLAVLDGLARQTARAAMQVRVVLDGCRDGSAQAVQAVGWPFTLKVVDQAAAGVAAARNRGAHEAAASGERSVTMGRHPPPANGADPLAALLRAWWEDHFRRKGQPGRPWSFLDFCSGDSALSRTQLLDPGGFTRMSSAG